MNDKLRADMPEVMRLMQAGQLQDATAAIQRMLGGQPQATTVSEPVNRTERAPIEGVFRVINKHNWQSSETRHAKPASPRPQIVPNRAPDRVPEGQFITGSFTNQAGTRAYKLYIPKAYHNQPLPLVVMLHGGTQNPDDFAAGTRMNRLAEDEPCLVLYPAQAQGANISKCWNWFNKGDQQRDEGEPSIIAGVTLQIMSDYSVDPRRVYVAGLSAGGAMAVIMATTYPELYAAAGIHSGLPYAAAQDMSSAFVAMRQGKTTNTGTRKSAANGSIATQPVVPTIVFHGDRDTTVHPCNGDQVIAQSWAVAANGGANGDARIGPEATIQRGQVTNGHAYTRTIYRDASGQANVEHWLVHGAGHTWAGGSPSGSFTDPKGPDATKELLRFFLEHPKPTRH